MGALVDGQAAVSTRLNRVTRLSGMAFCCLDTPKTLARFRLTPFRYRALLAEQGGVCAICQLGTMRGSTPAPLSVDHDHDCCPGRYSTCGGCVRGLLCPGCNGFLGLLELGSAFGPDDPEWRDAAIAYLVRRGCDLRDPARIRAAGERHRARAAAGVVCGCELCSQAAST